MRRRERVYLTPVPVRIWHWLNVFCILALSITGAEIRFPATVRVLGSYDAAVRLHNAVGVVFIFSYALWFVYYAFIARNLIQLYVPTADDIKKGMIQQTFYYCYQYFKGEPNPFQVSPNHKFNALQKTAYAAIMLVFTPLVTLTGVLLLDVVPLRAMVLAIGGMRFLIEVHWLLACVFCAFLFTHIYLATLGHTPFAYFRPMLNGWEDVIDDRRANGGG
jgi:thiosulfate reductase cytochrome b subunit